MAFRTLGKGDNESDPGIVAEINITPLTDIFLVLLIIFMVTSSAMSQLGVNVNLPKASHSLVEGQAEGVIVTLLPNGGIQVNGKPVALAGKDFENALQAAFGKATSRLIVLEGDRQALLGSAIEVMDRARQAGAEKFAIAAAAPDNASK